MPVSNNYMISVHSLCKLVTNKYVEALELFFSTDNYPNWRNYYCSEKIPGMNSQE